MYVHLAVDLKESMISMNDLDATIISSNFWPPIQVRKYFPVKNVVVFMQHFHISLPNIEW